MDPIVWGPKLWFFIHTIALNYPDNPTYQDITSYEEFFNNLKFTIPCDKCKLHYRQRLDKKPIRNFLTDSNTLFKYTIDLHNEVNKSLGKRIYSYDEVVEIYKKHYNKNYEVNNIFKKIFSIRNIIIVSIILVVILLAYYYKKKYVFTIIKR